MKTDLSAHAETAYQGFKAIDSGEYRDKISFVHRNGRTLRYLPVLEYAEVMESYAEALFETGRYHEHIKTADHLAELAIEYNIDRINGKDLYFETLFQKAASLYNLGQMHEAMYVLEELIRINPKHESSRLFLINCHVEKHKRKLNIIRIVSLVLILSSALVISLELLLVRPFFEQFESQVAVLRNILFITGSSVLVVGELWIRYMAVSKVYEFTRHLRKDTKRLSD
jgi:tetratricopeptide (TPR) repeat protein